jgi:molybdopterin-guanine dinucleotide biosynthesis protein A
MRPACRRLTDNRSTPYNGSSSKRKCPLPVAGMRGKRGGLSIVARRAEANVTQEHQPVSGVILAGGQSSRMGENKALMALGGVRLIDRVVGVLREVFDELLMVTNTPEVYADVEVPMVGDVFPGKGSLGGIYSAIYHVTTPYCFAVACDMPFLNASLIRYLVAQRAGYDVVMPDIQGDMQPLHAVYGKACLQPILRRLEADRLKIIGFLPQVRVRTVTAEDLRQVNPDLQAFRNLNTPEEFQDAVRQLRAP